MIYYDLYKQSSKNDKKKKKKKKKEKYTKKANKYVGRRDVKITHKLNGCMAISILTAYSSYYILYIVHTRATQRV